MNNIMPGQLATVMYRNIYKFNIVDLTLLKQGLSPGDRLLYLTLVLNGKIFCLQKVMSAYRHVTTHGDSFSATDKYSFSKSEKFYKAVCIYMSGFSVENEKLGEILYFRCIMKGLKARQCTLQQARIFFYSLKYKYYDMYMWILYKWRKDIMHKNVWM